jgi:hypothetical protein
MAFLTANYLWQGSINVMVAASLFPSSMAACASIIFAALVLRPRRGLAVPNGRCVYDVMQLMPPKKIRLAAYLDRELPRWVRPPAVAARSPI